MLRATQAVWFVGTVRGGYRPVGPCKPAFTWLVLGHVPRRADREDARFPLDHDVTCVSAGGRYESNAAGLTSFDFVPDGFCAYAGFAPAATSEDEPCLPVCFWHSLLWPGPETPVVQDLFSFLVGEAGEVMKNRLREGTHGVSSGGQRVVVSRRWCGLPRLRCFPRGAGGVYRW